MLESTRRTFLKLGAVASGVLAGSGVLLVGGGPSRIGRRAKAEDTSFTDALVGEIEDGLGRSYSPKTGQERDSIPSACWQCVARDGIVCHVEDGRLVHIEGNPKLPRTGGKLCSKGQGGVAQVYDPDRLLFPMKRTGARGAGAWRRISWNSALTELAGNLAELRNANRAEEFMFHYGRMKASSGKIIKDYFLYAFGTGTNGNHTSICESAKWTAQELTWGPHYDVNDVLNSRFILNFGSNPFEAHTSHIPFSQRLSKAVGSGTRLVTFDVRLSNTAARSSQWVPIRPGTDLAVILSMIYWILDQNLVPADGASFIDTWTNTTIDDLRAFVTNPGAYADAFEHGHVADQPDGGYTPEWAEGVSGVPAATIKALAEEYANNSPGSTVISYRGAVMHYNGVAVERAIFALEALGANIQSKGGRCFAVGAKWNYTGTYPKPSSSVPKLKVADGEGFAVPTHHSSHQVLKMIRKGAALPRDDAHRNPRVYLTYCYTPVFANGDMQENIDILSSEDLIEYSVNVNTSYDESAALADLLLPDATYLERWDYEDMVSYDGIPEFYIRQPVIEPLGEVRDFKDVCIELADRLSDGGDDPLELVKAIGSTENFVRAACEDTEGVPGFDYMKEHGAWYDVSKAIYGDEYDYAAYYSAPIDPGDAHMDEETGVYWNTSQVQVLDEEGNPAPVVDDEGNPVQAVDEDGNPVVDEDGNPVWQIQMEWPSYRETSKSYKKYVGQQVGDAAVKGFKPDKINKSGFIELDSRALAAKGWPGLPAWSAVPEHANLGDNLILTTFKVRTQIHSRSQNCKYLTELHHDNPAWVNPETAAAAGVSDGDLVTLTRVGELINAIGHEPAGTVVASMECTVKVTHGIVPGVVAIGHHLGHWEYGRYASGSANPMGGEAENTDLATGDPDLALMWWETHNRVPGGRSGVGYRPNWIMPNAGDPVSGAMRCFDTVVSMTKV